MTQFDMSNLTALIDDKFETREACARAAGITPATLSRCLSGSGDLKANQIKALRDALKIKPKDMDFYFFAERVAQNQQ